MLLNTQVKNPGGRNNFWGTISLEYTLGWPLLGTTNQVGKTLLTIPNTQQRTQKNHAQ